MSTRGVDRACCRTLPAPVSRRDPTWSPASFPPLCWRLTIPIDLVRECHAISRTVGAIELSRIEVTELEFSPEHRASLAAASGQKAARVLRDESWRLRKLRPGHLHSFLIGARSAPRGGCRRHCRHRSVLHAPVTPASGTGRLDQRDASRAGGLSMWGTDIICYGRDLDDYIDHEFGEVDQDASWAPRASMRFWKGFWAEIAPRLATRIVIFVLSGVITASEPISDVNPRQFNRVVRALPREGADAVRRGRPWGLSKTGSWSWPHTGASI